TATAMRPYGFGGKPLLLAALSSLHVLPPSAVRYRPLPESAFGPSPPDLNVQPLRRKSQRLANNTSGLPGSIATLPQPVDRLPPLSTSTHCLPPSEVLYSPRSVESPHNLPGTHASAVSAARGSTMILLMRSDWGNPACVQVSPPSDDL